MATKAQRIANEQLCIENLTRALDELDRDGTRDEEEHNARREYTQALADHQAKLARLQRIG